tara:strand:+ start:2197 stop:2451 length:255 start_codon:yes stop_codon:yes gene_type:complete
MKDIYFILGSLEYASSLGEAIRQNSGAASSFKAAYNAALSIGEIRDPRLGYKAALERVKASNLVSIKDGSEIGKEVIIAKIKMY